MSDISVRETGRLIGKQMHGAAKSIYDGGKDAYNAVVGTFTPVKQTLGSDLKKFSDNILEGSQKLTTKENLPYTLAVAALITVGGLYMSSSKKSSDQEDANIDNNDIPSGTITSNV